MSFEWSLGVELVSVIIPHCNCSHFLEDALRSVQWQTYPRIEVIVVDDASTELHRAAAHALCDLYRATYVQLPFNQGQSVARNEGVIQSQGRWIQALDADDVLLPGSIEARYRRLEPGDQWITGISLFVSQIRMCKPRRMAANFRYAIAPNTMLRVNVKRLFRFFWPRRAARPVRTFDSHGTLFSRQLFKEHGLFDEQLRRGQDTEIRERFLGLGVPMPRRLFRPVHLYRQHPDQITRQGIKSLEQNRLYQENLARRLAEGVNARNTPLLLSNGEYAR